MRLLVLTYGTEGDTRPLAVLCHGLQHAGHQVQLLAGQGTLGTADALGVPHATLAGDIQAEVVDLVAGGNSVLAAARGLRAMACAHVPAWMAQADAAAAGCDAVLAGGLAALVGASVAEHRRIPGIGLGMIPLTPTRAFASPFLASLPIPPALRRLSFSAINQTVWRSFRGPLNHAREAMGQPPRRRLWQHLPMLHGISPQLLSAPDDWPADHLVCGQWRLPSGDWQPDPALQAFLQAGPPPVYIGFGSMVGFDQNAVLPTLFNTLAAHRILLSPGWAGLPTTSLPDNVHVIGQIPHEALFPRCALIVHHGGSGTSHSACRAGVPSWVIPLAADQLFWAQRLHALGVAPPPLSPTRLDRTTLAAALAFAQHPETGRHARALGQAMASEAGVGVAIGWIERWLQR